MTLPLIIIIMICGTFYLYSITCSTNASFLSVTHRRIQVSLVWLVINPLVHWFALKYFFMTRKSSYPTLYKCFSSFFSVSSWPFVKNVSKLHVRYLLQLRPFWSAWCGGHYCNEALLTESLWLDSRVPLSLTPHLLTFSALCEQIIATTALKWIMECNENVRNCILSYQIAAANMHTGHTRDVNWR